MKKKCSAIVAILTATLADVPASGQEMSELNAIETRLTAPEAALATWIDARRDEMLAELRAHVSMNTGTGNIAGIDAYRRVVERELQAIGFSTRTVPNPSTPILTCSGGNMAFADNLVAELRGNNDERIFLNGHMDTVFPAMDEFQALEVLDDGSLRGPGVLDMKGGILVMLYALRALNAAELLDDAYITVALNSDEEIGSLGSRRLIEQLAREHSVGLIFEGSNDNRMTQARKGLGQVRWVVHGRESHAGSAHEDGVSATLELANKIVEVEQLTDYERHVTVNTGVFAGGEKRNTVPGCADAYIDLRFPDSQSGERLVQQIQELANRRFVSNPKYPDLPRTEMWSSLHRPAKPERAEVNRMIETVMGLSRILGEPVEGGYYSGGGTDGSLTQAVGLPTLDSLGLDGTGSHSSRETTSIASLMARTKLAAVILYRLIHTEL
jgi:glutamate carboxypeptidase